MTETAGLVVAGAGARGAYEAGAIASLLPRMPKDGPPPILVGTSAGALNVAGLGGLAHLGSDAAAGRLMSLWESVKLEDIFGPVSTVAGSGLRYLAQLAGLPVTLPSLLDTEPMRAKLTDLLPLAQLHENIAHGRIGAVAVTATSVATRGTVVFVEKHPSVPLPPYDPVRNITYVETQLGVEHVLASAAVPALFRPVHISEPKDWAGWYVDGGLLLNTPLKPALKLGADLLGIVATQPRTWLGGKPSEQSAHTGQPDVFGAAALTLRAVLADRMIEDLHKLERRNAAAPKNPESSENKVVEFKFAGPSPEQAGEIAALADRIFREEFEGLRGLQNPWLSLLARLIGGESADRGDLLSFLFFDPTFTTEAAKLGLAAAQSSSSPNQGP